MWSIIEPCVGIVAGSLPSIRPLFLLCYGGPEKGSKTTTTSSGSSRDASQTSTARSNSEGLSLDSSLPFIQRLWPLHKWRWNARGDTKMTAATKERETELGGVWTQTTVEISAVNCATVKPSERSSVVWTEVEKWQIVAADNYKETSHEWLQRWIESSCPGCFHITEHNI